MGFSGVLSYFAEEEEMFYWEEISLSKPISQDS